MPGILQAIPGCATSTPVAPVGGVRLGPLGADGYYDHSDGRRMLEDKGLDHFSLLNTVIWYPMPASMRQALKGKHKKLMRFVVCATSLIAVGGAYASLHGTGLLVFEAEQLKRYGVDHLSEARRMHLGQAGWAYVALGYFLTALEAVIALVYIGTSRRWRSVKAAYPEHTFMPHGLRAAGFAIGDFVVACVAADVALGYNYGVTPDAEGLTGFERSYKTRMAGGQGYALYGAAVIRLLTVVGLALSWEGLNVFYWICVGRCGEEWDSLHGLSADERKEEAQRQEAKVFSVLQQNATSRYEEKALSAMQRDRTKTDDDDESESGDESGSGDDGYGNTGGDQYLQSTIMQQRATARGDLAEVDAWRKILQFYRDPFGCFIYGWRSPNGVRTRGYNGCFATLAHNWWGALRMWVYASTLLLLWSAHLQVASGHYIPFASTVTRHNNFTWPVYVPLYGVPPLSYTEYAASQQSLYGLVPPPPSPPPLSPGAGVPASPPCPPTPPLPPIQPPRPTSPPHEPPIAPYLPAAERAFPHIPASNVRTQAVPPFPPDLSDSNDSSAWMGAAARVMFATELFRLVGYSAYALGVWRNEASVPGSHLPKRGCLRVLMP